MDTEQLRIVFLIGLGFAAFLTAVWVKEDAKSRGKPGWTVALMVILNGLIPGLSIWLVFRPDKKPDDE